MVAPSSHLGWRSTCWSLHGKDGENIRPVSAAVLIFLCVRHGRMLPMVETAWPSCSCAQHAKCVIHMIHIAIHIVTHIMSAKTCIRVHVSCLILQTQTCKSVHVPLLLHQGCSWHHLPTPLVQVCLSLRRVTGKSAIAWSIVLQ